MVYDFPVSSSITYLTVPVPRMVRPKAILSRVLTVWSSFRVTKSSLNGVEICEAQVSKYSLKFFNVAIVVELVTMALHVS